MERLFPRALLACIGEGRLPDAQELALVADKVGREAFSHRPAPGNRRHALNIAHVALSGDQLVV